MDIKSLIILNCFCLLILYFNPLVEGNGSFGFCANPECSEPVSKGITVLSYNSPDDNRISVGVNEEVFIYVKEYGPKKDLWGIIVRGNKGYISKQFIRETQMLAKRTVPAIIDFKTNILISEPNIMNNHLHPSSQQLQSGMRMSDAVPESPIYSHTPQQGFVSTPPNGFQQNFGNPSQNPEVSHSFSNVDLSSSVQRDRRFEQPNNIPMHPSHSHMGHMSSPPYMETGNIIPSPTPVPNVMHPSQPRFDSGDHSQHQFASGDPSQHPFASGDLAQHQFASGDASHHQFASGDASHHQFASGEPIFHSQSLGSSLHNVPNLQQQESTSDFPRGGHFDPKSAFAGESLQNGHEHPSLQQPQHFHSPYPSGVHSSHYSQDGEEELSRTMAMLSNRGYDENGVYGNSVTGSHVDPSSKNLDRSSGLNEAVFNNIPSQSQNHFHSSDGYLPPVNPSQPLEEANVVNSHAPVGNDHKPPENMAVEKEESVTEKLDDENGEEDELSEGEDDGLEEEEEEDVTAETDNPTQISEESVNTETHLNLQSSMSTTQMEQQQTSEIPQNIESSETSIKDSKLVLDNSVDEHTEPSSILNLVTSSVVEIANSFLSTISNSLISEKSESVSESFSKSIPDDVPERNNNGALPTDSTMYDKEHTTPNINDFFVESEQSSELDKIPAPLSINGISDGLTYHTRNLKGEEFGTTEKPHSDSDDINDENNTQSDSETHGSFENWLDAFRGFVDAVMSWIPEPLYSALIDLRSKDLSPRVPVFTALCGFICIFLIVPIIWVKEWSKESRLTAQLASVEKDAYTLSATNSVLEEKLESVQSELAALQASLAEEKNASNDLKMGFENQEEDLENAKAEIESCLQVIDSLKDKENEYLTTIQDQEKEIERFAEHKEALDKIMKDQENSISFLTDQLQESENKLKELEKEKLQFVQLKEEYEEKLSQFDKNCSQLLQEAEVWNLRVQELTTNLDEERKLKQEFIETLKVKDEEIESLKELVETFNLIDEIEDPEEQAKAKEEKLQSLMDSSMIVTQLKQEEEKSKLLDEQLTKEKNRILDMEVELLEAKSEIDKLKMSYNQALQDKAEAQTKLDVLTNYFKDKEIQLQKQLGAQEAVRQKKEEDANSAERRICLIEQENASYKYQVASMKQEMEETERNLKSQIATQEKKAHENWIAARAAERKLEDMKQEVTQLRQRLTLLEREQENWANASRDEVIRPVPKRIPGMNDESVNQDLNTSERGMFRPPPLHDHLPPHMLPPDRPLPPLLPPPMPRMFLPPMDRHFRPQPWHIPPDHSSDYRTTPPEFMAGRESTPPRGRPITDGDAGPHASSPLTTDTRDSRNSTPPHLLPDFHDVPPQPGRPFFPPPPLGHPRLPMHPQFRREPGPGPKRLDHPNEFNSRGSQQGPPQEQWQHSRV